MTLPGSCYMALVVIVAYCVGKAQGYREAERWMERVADNTVSHLRSAGAIP